MLSLMDCERFHKLARSVGCHTLHVHMFIPRSKPNDSSLLIDSSRLAVDSLNTRLPNFCFNLSRSILPSKVAENWIFLAIPGDERKLQRDDLICYLRRDFP
ncbi:hypothetical protein TNCV_2843241 [Trichonephila clavipes]|nr:hypothetical protein TNCV_2843241 [Trichonephila clavipes]